jgi:hypothetical protein
VNNRDIIKAYESTPDRARIENLKNAIEDAVTTLVEAAPPEEPDIDDGMEEESTEQVIKDNVKSLAFQAFKAGYQAGMAAPGTSPRTAAVTMLRQILDGLEHGRLGEVETVSEPPHMEKGQ